ncbi:MAG: GNAT family N-acetyltransferase [Bacteroidales bacterium]|nr:GNAT family N-acetyltransferase [Bacteroidales bacterium]
MVTLRGKNIILRSLEPADLELLYQWENDTENWFVSNTYTPYSRHALKELIESARKDIYENKQLRLMIDFVPGNDNEGLTVGAIDLFDFNPYHQRAGVGILIANKEYREKGIATEALAILIKYAFKTLGLHQLYCSISTNNEASINLFKKTGFVLLREKKDWLKETQGWRGEYFFQLINPEQ